MGANDREADGTITRNDFIHKYSIVRKEGNETDYWLHSIADTNPEFASRMRALIVEGNEIVKIVSTITTHKEMDKKRKNSACLLLVY